MKKNNLFLTSILVFNLLCGLLCGLFCGLAFAAEKPQTDANIENNKSIPNKIEQGGFYNVAVLQTLNKVTAKTSDLKIKIGNQVGFGKLIIKAKKCWKASPDQRPENKILLEITDEVEGSRKTIFNGWIFSSSPSISGIEHPIYDITAIECKN